MDETHQISRPKPPTPFYLKTRYVLCILIAGALFIYGWRVTEIDLGELFRDAHLVKPLVRDLAHPDLFTQTTESIEFEETFLLTREPVVSLPESNTPPPLAGLVLSEKSGRIGDPLTVEGIGLRPNAEGRLFWINSIEQEFPVAVVATDGEGNFHSAFQVPEFARGREQRVKAVLTWATGGWKVSHTLKLTFEKIVETLFLALMASMMAVLVAAPLSFLGARNLMVHSKTGTVIYYLVRTFFNVLRSIEPLILAILFAVWVGIGPFAGVLALGLHSIAALGKLYSEQIENIDPGPVEAIMATGANPVQVVWFGVVPQIISPFLAFTFYRWDINVRMSTIIGFVGGGGIGFLLQQWINLLKYREAGTALLAIALVVIALDTLSARIRSALA